MGMASIRARYARSKFGQTWLVVGNFLFIVAIAAVWALVWKIPIRKYLPYVGVGHLIYLFVVQTIAESSGIFIADARFYLNEKKSFFLSLFAHIYRNFIVFAHNIPILLLLLVYGDTSNINLDFKFMLALCFLVLFMFFSSYVVAVVCVRFRDMIQLVNLLFQVIFLVTPVMWQIGFIGNEFESYVLINPFAAILESIRNPLIGIAVPELALVSLFCWSLSVAFLAFFAYKKMHRNIIFWV